jgi:hypothetical protein
MLTNEANLRQARFWDYLKKSWDDKVGLKNLLPTVTQSVASSEYDTKDEGLVGSTSIRSPPRRLAHYWKFQKEDFCCHKLRSSPLMSSSIFLEKESRGERMAGMAHDGKVVTFC